MKKMMDLYIATNVSDKVITDLTDREQDYLDLALEFGWPMIQILHNFTLNVPDILDINFGVSSAVLRFNERITKDDFFKDNLG
mmetsp:Transcript_24152/g.37109  ORF Transcript_24152/g.37109 Transcript_24152/m.37109 type:complete len:83 (-) Transcript_24152:1061-1309(-)